MYTANYEWKKGLPFATIENAYGQIITAVFTQEIADQIISEHNELISLRKIKEEKEILLKESMIKEEEPWGFFEVEL